MANRTTTRANAQLEICVVSLVENLGIFPVYDVLEQLLELLNAEINAMFYTARPAQLLLILIYVLCQQPAPEACYQLRPNLS